MVVRLQHARLILVDLRAEGRVGAARSQRVDANAERPHFPSQCPGEVLDRGLGGVVVRAPLRHQVGIHGAHVDDHAGAIDLVLQKGQIGETYLISGEEKTNLEVTRKLLQIFGMDESMIEYVEHRLGHDFRYAINSNKIKKLGWKAKHSFDEWIFQTVNWYKQNEWWWKPLKQNRPNVDRIAQKGYKV